MNVLTAVLVVLAQVSLRSCRTHHSISLVRDSEQETALVSPRKVPTLAQLIPILEGPDPPEIKLRKLRKLIPIYDELNKWTIDHNKRLVQLLPFKKKGKPLAFILAGDDHMKLNKPDSVQNSKLNDAENDKKGREPTKTNPDKSIVNSKHNYVKKQSRIKRPHKKSHKSHTLSEYSTHNKDEYVKKYNREHSPDFNFAKHKNFDNNNNNSYSNKSEIESYKDTEPSSEDTESSNEDTVSKSSKNKSIKDKNGTNGKSSHHELYSNSNESVLDSEDDVESHRKENKSQRSRTKRPHAQSHRQSESKHFYNGDKKPHGPEHSPLHHNNESHAKHKNIDNYNSDSYSNESESESNEDTESSSEDTESESSDDNSVEAKNETDGRRDLSKFYSNSNKSYSNTINQFSVEDSASHEASSEGLSSSPFVSNSNKSLINYLSTKPNVSTSYSHETFNSLSEEVSLIDANIESEFNAISDEVKIKSEDSEISIVHADSLNDKNTTDDSNEGFRAAHDVASENHIFVNSNEKESVSESKSLSDTESDESNSEADSGIGFEVESKTAESKESLSDEQSTSKFPFESLSDETTESESDMNSSDSKSSTEFNNISDLESNQSESSVESNESQSESDSSFISEETSASDDKSVSVESASDLEYDASGTDENSSKSSSVSNESSDADSNGPESTSDVESASKSIFDVESTEYSDFDENYEYESIPEESVSDVFNESESVSDSNSSGLDSDIEPNGVSDVKSNESGYMSNENSNESSESEFTSEANSNESASDSYDSNESSFDFESKKYYNEEQNESTSNVVSNESKSVNVGDSNESGLESNSNFELNKKNYNLYETVEFESQSSDNKELGNARIFHENYDDGDYDVIVTGKSYGSESDSNGDGDDNEITVENSWDVTPKNDYEHAETTKQLKNRHHVKIHKEHVSDDDRTFDIKSGDTRHDVSDHNVEKENPIEVTTQKEHTDKVGNDEKTVPTLVLVKKHHHHVHDTTLTPKYVANVKEDSEQVFSKARVNSAKKHHDHYNIPTSFEAEENDDDESPIIHDVLKGHQKNDVKEETEHKIHKTSVKEHHKYYVGGVSTDVVENYHDIDDDDNEESEANTRVVSVDHENDDERDAVNSRKLDKHHKNKNHVDDVDNLQSILIKILIKKNSDEISKQILLKDETSSENDMNDPDNFRHQNHRYGEKSDVKHNVKKHRYSDVIDARNTKKINKNHHEHSTNQKLHNIECDASNHERSIAPKVIKQVKTYKLSFKFS